MRLLPPPRKTKRRFWLRAKRFVNVKLCREEQDYVIQPSKSNTVTRIGLSKLRFASRSASYAVHLLGKATNR